MDNISDFNFLAFNANNVWALMLTDSKCFQWIDCMLFMSREDAERWGGHLMESEQLCVQYHAVLLNELLSSIDVSSLIYRI